MKERGREGRVQPLWTGPRIVKDLVGGGTLTVWVENWVVNGLGPRFGCPDPDLLSLFPTLWSSPSPFSSIVVS